MPRLLHHISVRYPFNLFESLKVGNLLSILLLLNW